MKSELDQEIINNYLTSLCEVLDQLADPHRVPVCIECCDQERFDSLCQIIAESYSESFIGVMGTMGIQILKKLQADFGAVEATANLQSPEWKEFRKLCRNLSNNIKQAVKTL